MEDMIRKTIRKHVLANAIKYGKASPGNIIGKVFGERPELKQKAADVQNKINDIVEEVNKLSQEELKKELEKIAPELLEKPQEKKKELPKLKHNTGKVVMRFEPSLSGPLHVGHAYVLGLNAIYCKNYNGKLILRLADTNPANIYVDAYEMVPENAAWLTDNGVKEIIIQSSNMEMYYEHALALLKKGHAYVCQCSAESFREKINKMIACPCRGNSVDKNIELWHKMFDGFQEGDAVVRLKTEVDNKNPAMRDFPLFRINDEKHPKTGKKYRVWPLMNFAVAIDDHESSVTHIIRAKDHADNAKRQEYIYKYMGWDIPETMFVGRINFEGLRLSTTETRGKIKEGIFAGWDDPKLAFLPALRKRGFTPKALLRYAHEVGITLTDKKVTKEEFFKMINAFNKEEVDSKANRYFFVWSPVKINIKATPDQDFELDLHPNYKKGGRVFSITEDFYITKDDFGKLKDNKLHRLMDCINFTKQGKEFMFHSFSYAEFKSEGNGMIIHWLPADDATDVEIVTEEGIIKGKAERGVEQVKEGEVVQFERFGFARLDQDGKFYFLHR